MKAKSNWLKSKKKKLKKVKPLRNGQQLLIQALIARAGGPSKVSEKTGAEVHFLENAVRLGNIQPYAVRTMVKTLRASFSALDYKLYYMISESPKSWREVVKSCQLDKAITIGILKAEPPTIPEIV